MSRSSHAVVILTPFISDNVASHKRGTDSVALGKSVTIKKNKRHFGKLNYHVLDNWAEVNVIQIYALYSHTNEVE